MEASKIERQARAGLAVTRLMTAYLPLSIAQWLIDQSAARAQLPDGINREAVMANGVPCEWIVPDGSAEDRVLLYLHGGGFIYGLTSLHMEMVGILARQMGVRALMVDYRLAPQHPFPAALDDCVAAYRWLIAQGIAPEKIAIAGDSAGGNLTITTLMALRDAGDPLPAAAAGLSPVADLSDSDEPAGYDAVLHPRALRFMKRSYLGDNDPHNPLISPVFGDWHALPPLLVHAGEDEILCEDARQIAERLQAAGGTVEIKIYPRMWHVWQIYPQLPQAKQSLHEIAEFLTGYMA